jgi:hypothetical protein
MSNKPPEDGEPPEIPALFATIHFRSDDRPDGYTDEDIAALNAIANKPKPKSSE